MVNQVRSFSYRKVLTAITRNADDENGEDTMFALKTVMSTVDGIDQSLTMQVSGKDGKGAGRAGGRGICNLDC